MSTRSQIGLYANKDQNILKPEVLLYKHSDGYPEGVIPIIKPFLERFAATRGITDWEYCGAWLMHALVEEHIAVMKDIQISQNCTWLPVDGHDFLGFGICSEIHCDIEYYYRIYPNVIEVYETSFPRDDSKFTQQHFKLVNTIELEALKLLEDKAS